MILPGGLLNESRLERGYELAAPSGALELQLHALGSEADCHPEWLTRLLCKLLQRLGSDAPTLEQVERLCVADRQAIVLAWRGLREPDPQWWHLRCRACQQPFDIPLSLRSVPFSDAGDTFPFADADVSAGPVRVRVPDGRDLAWLARQHEHEYEHGAQREALVRRLLVEPVDIRLDEADLNAIEAALESCSPEIADGLDCDCPECGAANRLALDPYQGLVPALEPLFDDIHRLATNYHWSEAEILALPENRRRYYLDRIDADRGMTAPHQLAGGH